MSTSQPEDGAQAGNAADRTLAEKVAALATEGEGPLPDAPYVAMDPDEQTGRGADGEQAARLEQKLHGGFSSTVTDPGAAESGR